MQHACRWGVSNILPDSISTALEVVTKPFNHCCLMLQEPELLETLYVTQQMAPEAAELALETALCTLSNAISGNSSGGGATRSDSAISTAISGLQTAAQKYGQVGACTGVTPASSVCHVCLLFWC